MELLGLGLILWIATSFLNSDTKGQKVVVTDFRYRYKNGTWRAYFNHTPKSQDHVLSDEDGYYVCWSKTLKSEDDARKVAQMWVNRYG